MDYRPGLPKRNVNISHEHPLKEFFVLLAGTIGVVVAVFVIVGLFVDTAVQYIDPEVERQLFGVDGRDDDKPLTEPEQELQSLLDQLGNCVDVAYPVTVRISESSDMNAFARLGGRVTVLSGLLDRVKTENGIAFVLAHELGHFKSRDHLRSIGRALVLLAASVALTGANSDVSNIMTPVYSVETARFSQERERAADATALQALNCYYGHVGGATEFFELMVEPGDDLEWSLTHYFSSHPEPQDRIDDLRALTEELGFRESGVTTPGRIGKPISKTPR